MQTFIDGRNIIESNLLYLEVRSQFLTAKLWEIEGRGLTAFWVLDSRRCRWTSRHPSTISVSADEPLERNGRAAR